MWNFSHDRGQQNQQSYLTDSLLPVKSTYLKKYFELREYCTVLLCQTRTCEMVNAYNIQNFIAPRCKSIDQPHHGCRLWIC